MNRPSYSASSASWRRVIGSTSTESLSAMRAMYLIEAAEDGGIFSFGSYSTARSYFATVRALGSRHSRLVCWCSAFAQERRLAVGQPGDVARPDAVDREPGAGLDGHFERRAAEPVEQQPPERFETLIARDAEADQELELALGLEVGPAGAAVELVLELRQRVLVELGLAQLQHGLDGRHHPVPARFRQQRGVVALRLVGVGARQVDELGPAHVEQARTGEIFARRDHLVRGVGVGEVLGLVDQNDPAGHEGPFRMTMAALSRSRPRRVTRSNAVHGTA